MSGEDIEGQVQHASAATLVRLLNEFGEEVGAVIAHQVEGLQVIVRSVTPQAPPTEVSRWRAEEIVRDAAWRPLNTRPTWDEINAGVDIGVPDEEWRP